MSQEVRGACGRLVKTPLLVVGSNTEDQRIAEEKDTTLLVLFEYVVNMTQARQVLVAVLERFKCAATCVVEDWPELVRTQTGSAPHMMYAGAGQIRCLVLSTEDAVNPLAPAPVGAKRHLLTLFKGTSDQRHADLNLRPALASRGDFTVQLCSCFAVPANTIWLKVLHARMLFPSACRVKQSCMESLLQATKSMIMLLFDHGSTTATDDGTGAETEGISELIATPAQWDAWYPLGADSIPVLCTSTAEVAGDSPCAAGEAAGEESLPLGTSEEWQLIGATLPAIDIPTAVVTPYPASTASPE
eukprot:m51a1_g4861 hypothetical protein (302) ;mRNA; r:317581-319016